MAMRAITKRARGKKRKEKEKGRSLHTASFSYGEREVIKILSVNPPTHAIEDNIYYFI